ncbi:HalOD1 output domain-containing protein [Natronobiforma cellulositropha]|uniref:HalOD1 output domain-containing protein n=1 Tax=Natronobiforma cellulositropha TaxID=1679076 RepID=UPI0021D57FD5|nr:HalOD1 output domain-containing protein [Natronobiforma cellulositropha]
MTREILLETDGGEYQTITEAVVRAVAAVTNQKVTQMEPLYYAIDTDALERLFTSSTPRLVTVEFEYAEHTISVDGTGAVRVESVTETDHRRPGSESNP